jgi:Ca2+-binding RTX toxin-like protein
VDAGRSTLSSGTWREIADLANIENLVGTTHSDVLRGNGDDNVLFYTGGLDQFDGRGGGDTADFSRSGSAVWVDLAYTGPGNEAWTRYGSTLSSSTWREIADLANIENLVGTAHSDFLSGNGGDNRIAGGAGADTLVGLGGQDQYPFDTPLSAANIDRLADFTVSDDTIWFDDNIFTSGLLVGSSVAGSQFVIGAAALDGGDRIIYNSATRGVLRQRRHRCGSADPICATEPWTGSDQPRLPGRGLGLKFHPRADHPLG